jgi:hippurate hydrolase
MVTRRFNAADAVVVTVTRLDAGTAHNVIPNHATLRGTMRTLSREHRQLVQRLMRETADGIAAAHGVSAEVEITEGFPVTLCDDRAVSLGRAVTQDVLGAESWKDLPAPIMGAEDFSYVLEQVPGAMFFLGVAPSGENWSQCCGIHSSRMMVDESALPRGTAILAGCATHFLEQGFA